MTTNMPSAYHNRRNSRPDSTASVLTVKYPASSNRGSYRQYSPEDGLNYELLDPRTAARGRTDEKPGANTSINRWSHSTSSSTSAIDTEALKKKARNSQRRSSIGPGFSTNKPVTSTQHKPRNKSQPRSPNKSPIRPSKSNPYLLGDFSVYSQRDPSPGAMTATFMPQSMYDNKSSYDRPDEPWHRLSNHKSNEPVAAMSIQYVTPTVQKAPKVIDVSQLKTDYTRAQSSPERLAKVGDETTVTNSATANSAEQRRSRGHRSPTQKTMLSKALAKANTAVLLDNASNFDGAVEAYAEACDLLEQVMMRSSDIDDRKKLSAIRSTYSNRIAELHDIDDSFAGLIDKALPDDPPYDEANDAYFNSNRVEEAPLEDHVIPPRGQSLLPPVYGGDSYRDTAEQHTYRTNGRPQNLAITSDSRYMPSSTSPSNPSFDESETSHYIHAREISDASTSWLDTLNDTDSATETSSRLSSIDLGTGDGMNLVDEIEAEFDAAMNAAVESAYEVHGGPDVTPKQVDAKKRSSIPRFRGLALTHRLQSLDYRPDAEAFRTVQQSMEAEDSARDYLDDDTTEEEERLLDEVTQGYIFDDFQFDESSKSALPRQSDSSFSNQTWGSSVPSTSITNGTTLSTLAESLESSPAVKSAQFPPREQVIPPTPTTEPPRPPDLNRNSVSTRRSQSVDRTSMGLRDRRFSGQTTVNQLKIETFARPSTSHNNTRNVSLPKIEIPFNDLQAPHTAPLPVINGPHSGSTLATQPITPMASIHSNDSMTSESPDIAGFLQRAKHSSAEGAQQASSSSNPMRTIPPSTLVKKNMSSSSLRSRNLSVAKAEESPVTPGSGHFPPDLRKGAPPLPGSAEIKYIPQSFQAGGMYLFDDHTGSSTPNTPKTPSAFSGQGAPLPLEPCPESFLLRPFWLMRCLYEAISHPKGGYVSNKLFIPRDIWRVKNVKLKMLDDKISHCDLLTAALLKLSKVDNLDADAVLDELTSFEIILDQVRGSLQKKLGSEVGFSGSVQVFKSPTDETNDPMSSKSNNSAAKSFASSWRKLRSKSSTAASNNTHSGQFSKDSIGTHTNAGLTISSLPMTTLSQVPTSRSFQNRLRAAPPTPTQMTNIPQPHAQYMASLARLFDAVQILDLIARQVEDPGLKFSSKTHVGLELSVRNAAEFFAFYVIRFVMSDLMLLVDKFLKRGTEWVLA